MSDRFPHHGPLVLDGAMGTELERQGLRLDDPLWTGAILRDDPARVQAVHEAYLRAGAEILLTASYQLSHEPELLTRSVEVARRACEAVGVTALVAGSLGPYGAHLANGSEYDGHYNVSESEIAAYHRPRIAPLVDAGVDILAFETVPCLAEARAIASLLSEEDVADIPTWVSFCLGSAAHVASGDKLLSCVDALHNIPHLAGLGVNCGAPAHTIAAIASLRGVTDLALIAYPNRGGAYEGDARQWACAESVVTTENWGTDLLDAGADIVGGCCQTTPADVEVLRRLRDQREASLRP